MFGTEVVVVAYCDVLEVVASAVAKVNGRGCYAVGCTRDDHSVLALSDKRDVINLGKRDVVLISPFQRAVGVGSVFQEHRAAWRRVAVV